MTLPANLCGLIPIDEMAGDDENDTDSLRKMLVRAETYLTSFPWCPPIVERYIGVGISEVIALFLFRLERPIDDADQWLWVVEGDLPSAYFVVDKTHDPASALNVYCELMDEWCDAVENKRSLDEVFPVSADPTTRNAETLRSRVQFLREKVLPII
jgi:hypothetical protein